MSQILRLEYACTDAEIEEAQSLALRRQFGGSKRRTMLFLVNVLAVLWIVLSFCIYSLLPFQPVVSASVAAAIPPVGVGLTLLLTYFTRTRRENDSNTCIMEATETDLTIVAGRFEFHDRALLSPSCGG